MDLKTFKTQRSEQACYDLPHKIHCARTYPVSSPNGSTIIIYGHEAGVRVVWRGGHPFKQPVQKEESKSNGKKKDVQVISLDSDDEDTQPPAPVDVKPEFDDELEDPSTIVQFIDLEFGNSGVHIAVPSIPITPYTAASNIKPEIIGQKIIFAVAGKDPNSRLITLPLVPPSPASKLQGKNGAGTWGETITQLSGQVVVDGLSLTFTQSQAPEKENADQNSWNVLVASHSRATNGVLLIHRVPVSEDKSKQSSISNTPTEPIQTLYLASPAVSLSFKLSTKNPHLLLADRSGAVKIYNPFPSSSSASQGEWLLTLYPGFFSARGDLETSTANYGRKSIIDAQWVLTGAIMVLLSDGEYGIWDIDFVGPRKHHGSARHGGVQGGAHTPFTISGFLDGAMSKSSSTRSSQRSDSAKFAPMTPGSRRIAESTLFTSRSNTMFSAQGQIVVVRLPSPSAATQGNECALLRLQDSYYVIPNLWSFWEAQARKSEGGGSNVFGGGNASRMMKLETPNLRGERVSYIDYFPKDSSLLTRNAVPLDVLVTGEHRFVIASDTRGDSLMLTRSEIEDNTQNTVAGGELDVNNIDQALSRMENGNSVGNGIARRGVSFAS